MVWKFLISTIDILDAIFMIFASEISVLIIDLDLSNVFNVKEIGSKFLKTRTELSTRSNSLGV